MLNVIESKLYTHNKLGTFDEEWLFHKNCKDWWYATGYITDELGHRYSWQFTILSINLKLVNPYLAMVALTDLETGEHRYRQRVSLKKDVLTVTKDLVSYDDSAVAIKCGDCMRIKTHHKDFSLDLQLDYGKGAFWHCDNGLLQMGQLGDKETTYYYSYTNLPTVGTLTLGNREYKVSGKTWFDKQGGSYSLGKVSSWEWFSLRFYDNEEMMLFKFPTTDYIDGTFINVSGNRERLNNYRLTTTKYIEYAGSKWSAGWELIVPGVKEEKYTITPIVDGAINLAYFEEICSVKNSKGEEVGLCFAELLPHLYDNNKQDHKNLFKNIEY